jgi:hypothetical protein
MEIIGHTPEEESANQDVPQVNSNASVTEYTSNRTLATYVADIFTFRDGCAKRPGFQGMNGTHLDNLPEIIPNTFFATIPAICVMTTALATTGNAGLHGGTTLDAQG